MQSATTDWDYLIVTASNDAQADAYSSQLGIRHDMGLLTGVRQVLVVGDPGGKRVGSGGSTLYCLMQVIERELGNSAADTGPAQWQELLSSMRILIVHAGGDSRRLPAYGPCGKLFVPIPAESDSVVSATLFDRQLPTYLALEAAPQGMGQIVISAGDVLLGFDPEEVDFSMPGITGLGCMAAPGRAGKHGVYCANGDGSVRMFLQKPTVEEQQRLGAIDRYGQSVLDIGVIQFDAETAAALLSVFDVKADVQGKLSWRGEMGKSIEHMGLDFYREICCALGDDASAEHHVASARASKSQWSENHLGRVFEALHGIPFQAQILNRCGFLHFGTTKQIISSGRELLKQDRGLAEFEACLDINNDISGEGRLVGTQSWVEGCTISAPLTLPGRNVVLGVDIEESLQLPEGICLDVVTGHTHSGSDTWFVRCYGVDDTFKHTCDDGGTICNMPASEWMGILGASPDDIWDRSEPQAERTVWSARIFPAVSSPTEYRRWLWVCQPEGASSEQKSDWLAAERYSLAEIATLADQDAFHSRRRRIRAQDIRRSLRRLFRNDSGFSAHDLARLLSRSDDRAPWVAQILTEAHWHHNTGRSSGLLGLIFGRVAHTLGSAIGQLAQDDEITITELVGDVAGKLSDNILSWLKSMGIAPDGDLSASKWGEALRAESLAYLGRTIVSSGAPKKTHPTAALRADEIVWGRAPARLDIGGGWTDTPPYTLENGGCVINAAVNLNGQPPIHCYARVIDEPIIRMASIDRGLHIEISEMDDLLDYRNATGDFALAKASLALGGFAPEACGWPSGITLRSMLERFGGGIELTTLATIPKGSGLGTSSIVGAVILATVQRMMGRELDREELFHGVLKLEQALTTGGGWQDQVGGAVDGVKIIDTNPGIVPTTRIHYVPADVLDPVANNGCTLLYYTGITRLAKNILQQVVGRYLDRDRLTMATLQRIGELPTHVADAMASKDMPEFGRLIDVAWQLNKQLDPNSSNEATEELLARVRPHLYGAKLLGAGGGGFTLMICKSPADAAEVRRKLEADPPNELARFFDFSISTRGLVVTVC